MRRRASIHDRDNKLWHGSRFILPEHREAMLIHDRREQRQARPRLEQDKLAEMNRQLAEALETGQPIGITLYKPYGSERITVIAKRIDMAARTLKGTTADEEERPIAVSLDDLIDITPG
jgi:hypothetical protein